VLLIGSSAWLVAEPGTFKIPSNAQPRATWSSNQLFQAEKNVQPEALPASPVTSTPTPGTPPSTTIASSSAQPQKINRASSLIGTTVKNQLGENVGKIRDVVINFSTEHVAYCVLDANPGVLNAEKLHAVPLQAFQPAADGTSLTLNVDKEKLAQSEGFDKNNWPDINNPAWGAEIQRLQSEKPGTTDTQGLKQPDKFK
jgi:sporulation protein YlmC with PRC-barrel domain